MKLSAVIIAKNNEEQIKEAIASVAFCDEVIVVDGGSTDQTGAVSKKLGAKVIKGVGDNFSTQREIGRDVAKGEWILYIDTDERVSPQLADCIKNTIVSNKGNGNYSAYRIQRKNFYLGANAWPSAEKLERLFLKKNLKGWKGVLHETAVVEGNIGELEGYLNHYTHRDLSSMLEKTLVWSGQEARLRFEAHHPRMTWWRFPRVMLTAFYDSYILQGGWKVGTAGLIESMYQAYSMFVTYARLWEIQQKSSK